MKSIKYWSLVILLLACGFSSPAQFFKKGDRVCFVGNSITHNGDYWHNIQLYYATRYPQLGVQFFNCGISGDVTGGILRRMDHDILIHRPTWAVIMIGMNDVNRPLYDAKRKNEEGIREKQQAALAVYRRNLDSIIRVFHNKGIRVVLQTPSIYDQTSKMAGNNLFGVNDALKVCAGYVREFAAKDSLTVVDYWAMLTKLNAEVQATDSTATLISKDRVHPAGVGHLLMAWEFLRTIMAPAAVAYITADQSEKGSQAKSQQCTITNFTRKDGLIRFTALEKSLPFPVRADQQPAVELVPFAENLNREILKFNYLVPGNYTLTIDGVEMGSFFSGELERGLNLALLQQAPQYQQALKVQALLQKSWQLEGQIRALRLIEHRYINNLPGSNNLETVRRFYDTAHAHKPDSDNVRKMFVSYLENKPKEADLIRRWQHSLDSLPLLNKPAPHEYVLKKN